MLSLGVKQLNDILGGGVEEGSSVAFVGSIEYDNVILMHQAVLKALESGKRVLVVDFRQPPPTLLKELRSHGIDYEPFLDDSLTILDGYSNLYGQGVQGGRNVLPNPLDLGITTAIIREALQGDEYDILVIDDVTAQYTLQSNPKIYIKAIVRLVNSVKSLGKTTFVAVCSDVFEKSDLAAILIPFDYVIEVAGGKVEIKRSLQPLRVLEPKFAYIRTRKGINPTKEHYQSIEGLKAQLRAGEDGTIWLKDTRVQIVEEATERTLIETVYDFLGLDRGKELLYTWGKKQFLGYGEYSKRHNTSIAEALEDIFKFTMAGGGGRLELVELSDSVVIVRGTHLFPGGKGYPYPFHPNYAGSLAQFLTEFTGERWEGEETKCEAMGAEHCEFVLRKVR
ncbi:V4R domain-containing protein [Thermococcus sp. 21S9]|uniref:V4R domain-containing protein n=1 Tax=Thermococcus sp. 21S9 TaxID=1638223 RepID=UPI00143A3E9F|nr:V4R domain-containing protein [Thermococcus sp. 21S9]